MLALASATGTLALGAMPDSSNKVKLTAKDDTGAHTTTLLFMPQRLHFVFIAQPIWEVPFHAT